jgi:hypothetical protein
MPYPVGQKATDAVALGNVKNPGKDGNEQIDVEGYRTKNVTYMVRREL